MVPVLVAHVNQEDSGVSQVVQASQISSALPLVRPKRLVDRMPTSRFQANTSILGIPVDYRLQSARGDGAKDLVRCRESTFKLCWSCGPLQEKIVSFFFEILLAMQKK